MGAQYIGQRLGDYVLTKHLGEGGFADVYLGQHVYLHTDDYPVRAAIKVLKGEFTAKEITDLRNEAQTIIHLKHPHIVPLITFSVAKIETQNIPFLVMDYASHGSLDKRYPRGTELPLAMIVSYVKQIAQALQYAHDHRVVHRDIKPANFLLGRNEEVLPVILVSLSLPTGRALGKRKSLLEAGLTPPQNILMPEQYPQAINIL